MKTIFGWLLLLLLLSVLTVVWPAAIAALLDLDPDSAAVGGLVAVFSVIVAMTIIHRSRS